jgi:orotate phosphoribosyltransferase
MDYLGCRLSHQTSQKKRRLAEIILTKSFKYSENQPFKLASGKTSHYYFNCKPTTLDPEGMNLIGEIIFELVKDSNITATGGLTLGADPIANALSLISFQKKKPIKSFIVRKDIKEHGTKSSIEGEVHYGEKVAIIDDVITTGGSTIMAIMKAKEAGLDIDRVIVLIDRQEGGRENIMEYVKRVDAVFMRDEILELYKEMNRHLK